MNWNEGKEGSLNARPFTLASRPHGVRSEESHTHMKTSTMKTSATDTRSPIFARLNSAVKKDAPKTIENDAWYIGVVSGPTRRDKTCQTSYKRLVRAARAGQFSEVMECCALLGEWWLAQECNSMHLMRDDVKARIAACRKIAAAR